MKKVLVILFGLFFFVACSKSEDSPAAPATYGVNVEQTCRGSQTSHCISKETYDYLKSLPFNGYPCNWISVRDIDGKSVSGYLRSFGATCTK